MFEEDMNNSLEQLTSSSHPAVHPQLSMPTSKTKKTKRSDWH